MIGFAMFTRGHVHDSSIPVTIESWGALSFFREVLKRDPADVSALFELWGVTHARGRSRIILAHAALLTNFLEETRELRRWSPCRRNARR